MGLDIKFVRVFTIAILLCPVAFYFMYDDTFAERQTKKNSIQNSDTATRGKEDATTIFVCIFSQTIF